MRPHAIVAGLWIGLLGSVAMASDLDENCDPDSWAASARADWWPVEFWQEQADELARTAEDEMLRAQAFAAEARLTMQTAMAEARIAGAHAKAAGRSPEQAAADTLELEKQMAELSQSLAQFSADRSQWAARCAAVAAQRAKAARQEE